MADESFNLGGVGQAIYDAALWKKIIVAAGITLEVSTGAITTVISHLLNIAE